MPVKHLLKQVELYRSNRNNRDFRPEWVTEFINNIAEAFEPFDDVGRVGFECRLADDRWEAGLYLGSIEMVGGKEDGQERYGGFRFDVNQLVDQFDEVDRLQFDVPPQAVDKTNSVSQAVIVVEGRVSDHPLRVTIYSIPPEHAGPGFRQFPNGERDTV